MDRRREEIAHDDLYTNNALPPRHDFEPRFTAHWQSRSGGKSAQFYPQGTTWVSTQASISPFSAASACQMIERVRIHPGPETLRNVERKSWKTAFLGSQTSKSRPDPPFCLSFLELSWFERRRISNGSNRVVRNAAPCQAAFSTTTRSNRRCSAAGCCKNNSLARLVSLVMVLDGKTEQTAVFLGGD